MRPSDSSGTFDQPPENNQPRGIQTDGIGETEPARENEALESEAPDKEPGKPAEREIAERTEWTAEGGRDAAGAAASQDSDEDRRRRQAAVHREFDGRLVGRIARTDGLVEALGEREGRGRGDSLAEIGQEISALDDLLAEHTAAARLAAGPLLTKDAADQIARFHADAEDLAGHLRHLERVLLREERIEDGHLRRVRGLLELELRGTDRTIVTKVAHAIAVVLAEHAAPGHGDLLAGISEWVTKACDTPERFDNARGLKVRVPLPIGGLLAFDLETTLSPDVLAGDESSVDIDADPNPDGEPANYPQVELVEEIAPADNPPAGSAGLARPAEPAADRAPGAGAAVSAGLGWPAAAAWADRGLPAGPPGEAPSYELAAWLHYAPQAGPPEPRAPAAPGGRRDLPFGAGVVIWGSARAVALRARTRILSAGLLLSCGREAAFEKVYEGTPESVAHAMRVARGLEVVVFLDPDLQGGAWIDVDPVTQAPAATFLIDMPISAGTVQGFRLLES